MSLQVSLLFIVSFVNFVLGIFLLVGRRDRINLIFSLFAFSAAMWAGGLGFFISVNDLGLALFIANLYYVAAAAISVLFLAFSVVFLGNKSFNIQTGLALFIPLILLIILLSLDKNLIIDSVFWETWGKNVVINKFTYSVYGVTFIIYVALAFYYLLKRLFSVREKVEKTQLRIIIGGTFIPYMLGMYFNLFLPWAGNYRLIWAGPIFSIMMVGSIGYAVTRHHLFNIKVIATELFIFALWIFTLVRIVLPAGSGGLVADIIFLTATITLGILVIRGVLKEVSAREKIQVLAEELAVANLRLKELDRQKSEFVSIASHQLRSPLTAIKGYSSMLLEGSFGHMNGKAREAVDRIFQSSNKLVVIIEDFLNITRIELGRMKYEMSKTVEIYFRAIKIECIFRGSYTARMFSGLNPALTASDASSLALR